ncbi:MAG: hypothetical protein J5883_07110 [Clostridiales bacterium]|nr:hypothetical protein [Clostridiales bacterium]
MKKTGILGIFSIILILVQFVLNALLLLYAFFGTYTANRPSNIWAGIWHSGTPLLLVLFNFISFIFGIVSLIISKKERSKMILAFVLIGMPLTSIFCFIMAIGAHY